LDCDPFLQMQDWAGEVAEKLKVEKEPSMNDVYRVYLWDEGAKSYKTVRVRVKCQGGAYRIDELLDLN